MKRVDMYHAIPIERQSAAWHALTRIPLVMRHYRNSEERKRQSLFLTFSGICATGILFFRHEICLFYKMLCEEFTSASYKSLNIPRCEVKCSWLCSCNVSDLTASHEKCLRPPVVTVRASLLCSYIVAHQGFIP